MVQILDVYMCMVLVCTLMYIVSVVLYNRRLAVMHPTWQIIYPLLIVCLPGVGTLFAAVMMYIGIGMLS